MNHPSDAALGSAAHARLTVRSGPWSLLFLAGWLCLIFYQLCWPEIAMGARGSLRLVVRGPAGDEMPCRVHLWNEEGVPQRAPSQPFWHDHFICPGQVVLDLEPGRYRYLVERGPEFRRVAGNVQVTANHEAHQDVLLRRLSDLRGSGWYSGDLHVHRPVADIERLMAAEDLDLAPVITWWNARNELNDDGAPQQVTQRTADGRIYNVMAGEDEREGGALLFFGLRRPLDLSAENREFPSPMSFVQQARQRRREVWIDIEKPFWWDVPVWLATGQMQSIGLANNHMCHSQMLENEAWGKPRDVRRLPPPRGNGWWTQEIYYHVLDSGLHIPPSAGSASGVLPNPVGYNRVYVHLEDPFAEPFAWERWFAGLRRGQCFVTNGPLLVATANGELPGATFTSDAAKPLQIDLKVELSTQDPVPQLELVHNGKVAKVVACSDQPSQRHRVAFSMSEPGWFLIRAVSDVPETFRFASTAPWYVESPEGKRRISRQSAQFFADWVEERMERVESRVGDPQQREEVLVWHRQARDFWKKRVAAANAD